MNKEINRHFKECNQGLNQVCIQKKLGDDKDLCINCSFMSHSCSCNNPMPVNERWLIGLFRDRTKGLFYCHEV